METSGFGLERVIPPALQDIARSSSASAARRGGKRASGRQVELQLGRSPSDEEQRHIGSAFEPFHQEHLLDLARTRVLASSRSVTDVRAREFVQCRQVVALGE